MTEDTLKSTLVSLEEEIRLLKEMIIKKKLSPMAPKKRFSSLEGLWKGKTAFSLEEIKGFEIQLKEGL